MKRNHSDTKGIMLKILLGTVLVAVLGTVAFLSREIQPETKQVVKVLDVSKLEQRDSASR